MMHVPIKRFAVMILVVGPKPHSSALVGQDAPPTTRVELSAGLMLPLRALSAGTGSTRLRSAPFAGLALAIQTSPRVSIRFRGASALTQGTTSGQSGRLIAGLGELLITPVVGGPIELGFGVGVRRYLFEGDDCAGNVCGIGNMSQTAALVASSGAVRVRIGGIDTAVEVGGWISGYHGRTMLDVTIGARVHL